MLYLVSTPIGNLEDITLRALNTLFSMEAVYCEDTRVTLNLLRHYQKPGQIIPKLVSYYEENEPRRIPEIIFELKKGSQIALATNAGTPTISDPGFKLVRECLKENIRVISIPGACSPIAALTSSGLPTDKFTFLGFLPNKSGQRVKLFEKVKVSLNTLPSTIIFLESPYRIAKSLEDLRIVFGDIEIVIAREMTKVYEETKKEKTSVFLEQFMIRPPKGEFVVLFHLVD